MKTENISSGDLWNNNVDLLTDESCLPVIGTCHITSILSNLDPNENPEKTPGFDNVEAKFGHSFEKNYVVLKDSGNNTSTTKKNNLKNDPNNFEDMLYFVCNLCPFLCTKQTKITEHLENAHKTKTIRKLPHLKCPACSNVFFHKMSLRSHLIHDHGVGNSDINLIIQAVVYYANKAKGNDKKKAVNSDTKPKTEKIQLNTSEELTDTKHVPDHIESPEPKATAETAKKSQSCIIPNCKVTLQNPESMSYHISCHKGTAFHCLMCNENFPTWKPLASHLWRLHKIDIELYSCDQCDYKSVSLAKLNNIHKLIHGDVKAYVCNVCNKGFKNSKQLGNHKITHRSVFEKMKFNCEACGRNFSDRRQLRIHMSVVHEKLKPFLCNYCGYKGSSRSSLKMHIRQHTGEKPFACDACNYTTSDHNSLRRHKLRHTGTKPYKCMYCSYACIQSSTYKVHLKTKHPGQEKDLMFTCPQCQFRSVNKEMYLSHMLMVHHEKLTQI